MKRFSTLVFATALASYVSVSNAAYLSIEGTFVGDSVINTISLSGLTEADEITFLSVEIRLDDDVQFENFDADGFDGFLPRVAGDAATFTNGFLEYPEAYGGKGWIVLDQSDPSRIFFVTGNPGGSFLTAESLLLSNVMRPWGLNGQVVVELFNADNSGIPIDRLEETFFIPEPTSSLLAGMGLIGCLSMRRHKASH